MASVLGTLTHRVVHGHHPHHHTWKICCHLTPQSCASTLPTGTLPPPRRASSPSELIRLSRIVSVVDKRKGRRIERELVRTKPVTRGHLLCSYLRDNLWDWKIKEGHDQHVLVLTAYGSHQVALSPANYHTAECTSHNLTIAEKNYCRKNYCRKTIVEKKLYPAIS